MKAQDLFTVVLKVIGIYLIKDVLLSIPAVFKTIYLTYNESPDIAIFSVIISLLVLGVHVVIVYMLLFKTGFLISKLNLTSGLSDEPLILNLHRSSVYTIAIIISGLIILTFAIPRLIRQLYFWYEYLDSKKNIFNTLSYDYSELLIAITEVIIGLLFLGNQRTLVNFIELKRRKTLQDEQES